MHRASSLKAFLGRESPILLTGTVLLLKHLHDEAILTSDRDYRFDPEWTYGLPGTSAVDELRFEHDMLIPLCRTGRSIDHC